MSPRAQLADFPNNLIDDDRLLSQQEREIVTTLLRHANQDAGHSAETRSAMLQVIERTVGETVAQRAYGLLGSSIVRKLMKEASSNGGSTLSALTVPEIREQSAAALLPIPIGPQPPAFEPTRITAVSPPPLQPQHPGFEEPRASVATAAPPLQPQPPREEPRTRVAIGPPRPPGQPQSPGFEEPRTRVAAVSPPPLQPEHPGFEEPQVRVAAVSPPPSQPEHPGFEETQITAQTSVAVMDAPKALFRAAQCLVLDEFLVPEEVDALMRFALAKESEFKLSEVIAPGQKGTVDFDHRRSHVLVDIGEHEDVIVGRIKSSLPRILDKLNLDPFEISRVEAQITASGDGDFFHQHTDDGEGKVAARELTFVYFFHREPKAFTGGELRIYDSVWKDGYYQAGEKYRSIQPAQNQIVLFPSCLVHEITPIEIPSRAFADSRFTVNGWFRR